MSYVTRLLAVPVRSTAAASEAAGGVVRYGEYTGGQILTGTVGAGTTLSFHVRYIGSSVWVLSTTTLTVASDRAYAIPAGIFGAEEFVMTAGADYTVDLIMQGE